MMVRVAIPAISQLITNITFEVGDEDSAVSLGRKGKREGTRMPYHSVFLTKDETGPQPANLAIPTLLKPSVKDFMFLCQVMC